jgi:DNA-binding NarL/FixJ family response regulator
MIVDDHLLFRECLASMFAATERFTVHGLAEDAPTALEKARQHQPDVVLISLSLPHGAAFDLTKTITREWPDVKVLVLGLTEVESDILRCVESGAHGYVLKAMSLDDLKMAIELVMRGETVCSPQIAHLVFSRLATLARGYLPGGNHAWLKLTPREMEVLQLIAEGYSNKQIAHHLVLSLHTVKNHVHNILEKLQVRRRYEAVEHAYKREWLIRKGELDAGTRPLPVSRSAQRSG